MLFLVAAESFFLLSCNYLIYYLAMSPLFRSPMKKKLKPSLDAAAMAQLLSAAQEAKKKNKKQESEKRRRKARRAEASVARAAAKAAAAAASGPQLLAD